MKSKKLFKYVIEKEFTSLSLVLVTYVSLKCISPESHIGLILNMFNMSCLYKYHGCHYMVFCKGLTFYRITLSGNWGREMIKG